GVGVGWRVGWTGPEVTVMVKAGSDAEPYPSLVLITIPEYVPTFVAAGFPLSCPVALLKLAHEGWFAMEKVRVLPEGSFAVGVNEYAAPTVTLVPGVPEMVGGEDDGTPLPVRTCTENAGKVAVFRPSLTAITMFEYVPTLLAEGVPES